MNILGISAFYHDSAAALVSDGEIVAAAQEERFTRIKHDESFPTNAIEYCLHVGQVAGDDLDMVVYYDKPLTTFVRILRTYLRAGPKGFRSFQRAMPIWLRQKLWTAYEIEKGLGSIGVAMPGDLAYTEHHESHAASAFFPSPFQRAAILCFDGVGEWATSSIGVGRDNTIDLTHQINFPHSIGLLYSTFTQYCGFRVNSGEYKLMGLAPYGEPRYADTILSELVDLRDDGSFEMDMRYFGYVGGMTMTNRRFEKLFGGPAREPEADLTQKECDLAASIQHVTEEIVLTMARHAHAVTGEDKAVLAGGVALNCVANERLLRDGPFEEIWIQPAAGDAGGALGAALYGWHQIAGEPRTAAPDDSMRGSYLGPRFDSDEIAAWLDEQGLPYTRLDPGRRAAETAALVAAGGVVGLFQGRMEFGPRALGHRSIIGDPRDPEMQVRMNRKIKYRESFRPFAPSVLAERAAEWFDVDYPSPYMLITGPVAESRRHETPGGTAADLRAWAAQSRSEIPAITHVDGSARLQTVDQDRSPAFHAVLAAFEELTGCPVLINTSFNVRGEPVVCTPEDAYACFMRTEMDHLVMEDVLLHRHEQPEERMATGQVDEFALD
jgi:carbamoyltransferase